MPQDVLPLRAAAELSGQSVVRLGQWCATGKLRCERDGTGWLIPPAEIQRIDAVARDHATAIREQRITALAVPLHRAPADLADIVASRLGVSAGSVSIRALALDGVAYVVAVWRRVPPKSGGLPELQDLAVELGAELLDGEITTD